MLSILYSQKKNLQNKRKLSQLKYPKYKVISPPRNYFPNNENIFLKSQKFSNKFTLKNYFQVPPHRKYFLPPKFSTNKFRTPRTIPSRTSPRNCDQRTIRPIHVCTRKESHHNHRKSSPRFSQKILPPRTHGPCSCWGRSRTCRRTSNQSKKFPRNFTEI
jgi:hypothetical protein